MRHRIVPASDAAVRRRVRIVDAASWRRIVSERGVGDPELVAALRVSETVRFEAKEGQSLPVVLPDGGRLLFVGRGSAGSPSATLRSAAASAAALIPSDPSGEPWQLELPQSDPGLDIGRAACAAAEGLLLSGYQFRRSGTAADTEAESLCIVAPRRPSDSTHAAIAAGIARAHALVAGIVLTRDLVNAPASELGPTELADAARAVAKRAGATAECFVGREVEARGFRMVAAVGRASAKPPSVTIISRGLSDGPAPIALIGKGVTFDSGGLDLKPSDSMVLMKKDMAGAATVLGAIEAFGRLGGELPFLAIIPSAENMIGPESFRPGDVLRAYDGTTVEIGNTDAEGRLLLADAIGCARERGAARLLDYATLTGAARVALGPEIPALFASDDELAARVARAAELGDEPVWRLPLVDAYEKQLDSTVADLNHVSHDKRAGAITAALFLRRFAKSTPWAHVDFYGWEDAGRPETKRGANGMGVRTIVALLEELGRELARVK